MCICMTEYLHLSTFKLQGQTEYFVGSIISVPVKVDILTLKVLNFWKFTSYCSLNPYGRA